MPSESFQYFIKDKTLNILTPSIYGYFDFDNSGIYGNSSIIDNKNWLNKEIKIKIENSNAWQNSGFLSFSGNSKFNISGLTEKNLGFFIPYYLQNNNKNNIILSSKVDSGVGFASGYTFGINKFNFPYVEFFDYLNGPTTYCLHENVNNTGIVYFSVKTDLVELGYYDAINKKIKKEGFIKNKNSVFDSNSWFIGGDLQNNYNNFLSGKIPQLAIVNSNSFDINLYEKNIISGLISELDTYISTGFISGQTGILKGDVISLSGCYYYYSLSGQFDASGYETGVSYYTTKQVLTDCIGREYEVFTQNILSGYFSGFRWVEYLNANCFKQTGYNFYQYDSGIVLNYSIKTILPKIKYFELDNFYANAILLNSSLDISDKLSVYALKQVNRNIDYGNSLFNIFNKTYFIDGDLNINNFSGFYYNGQLQSISNNFSQSFQNGEIVYLPEKDFFISGSTIYSNKYFDFGNVNVDSWPTFDFIVTGSLLSGNSIPGANFANQMVYLNGQKLISGIDYANNTLLINVPTGYNIFSITRNKLNFYEKNISNTGGLVFNLDTFTKNTSSVWLNGLRLKNHKDYIELLYNDSNDIYIKRGGNLIFNL